MKPTTQYDLFEVIPQGIQRVIEKPTGATLRDKGIKKAVDNANKKVDQWSEKCYELFLQYLKTVHTFKCENFRKWVELKIESDKHKRAFGAIVLRAQREGLIFKADMTKTSDQKSHSTNCNLWQKI